MVCWVMTDGPAPARSSAGLLVPFPLRAFRPERTRLDRGPRRRSALPLRAARRGSPRLRRRVAERRAMVQPSSMKSRAGLFAILLLACVAAGDARGAPAAGRDGGFDGFVIYEF